MSTQDGLAYARSDAFYDATLFWQWMRMPGDIVFALGALLMAWDFIVKLRPVLPFLSSRDRKGAATAAPDGVRHADA